MCELFGMVARHPATVSLSFSELARHGGLTDRHRDGWGIAWYDGTRAFVVREATAASGSPQVRALLESGLESRVFIAHVRYATQGEVALRNTQPFVRHLAGRDHVFAHNGDLHGLSDGPRRYAPEGDTDSERAFCDLLDRMAVLYQQDPAPSVQARQEVFTAFAAEAARLGPANFLYSDGEVLFAHSHQRRQPDGRMASPGLHKLTRSCPQPATHPFAAMEIRSPHVDQHVNLLASVPLSAEGWRALPEGEVLSLQEPLPF